MAEIMRGFGGFRNNRNNEKYGNQNPGNTGKKCPNINQTSRNSSANFS